MWIFSRRQIVISLFHTFTSERYADLEIGGEDAVAKEDGSQRLRLLLRSTQRLAEVEPRVIEVICGNRVPSIRWRTRTSIGRSDPTDS